MSVPGERDFLGAERLEVLPRGPLGGTSPAAPGPSVTNRLLLMAALAEGRSQLSGVLRSDDTAVMARAVAALGAGVADEGEVVVVEGTGGRLREPAAAIGAGLSGTTLRWVAAAALLVHGTVVIDGGPSLRRRPIVPLLQALEELGAAIETDDGRPPLRITSGGLPGGRVTVDAAESSQFATGLLLVSPYAEGDVELEVLHLGAAGYVELTVEAMARWGASVTRVPSRHGGGEVEGTATSAYLVTAGRHYLARSEVVEYDASAAAHLFALAMATGGRVTVPNVVPTRQPDAGLTEVFEAMGGVAVPAPGGGIMVSRPGTMRGTEVDVAPMPDQVPTLAVLGALAKGTTRLRGASVARGHETDRVGAIARELRGLGADVEEEGDTLVVQGGRPLTGGLVGTYDDHRMAMALSCLGAVVPGVVITDPGCVAKTYPGYWEDAASLGLGLRAAL